MFSASMMNLLGMKRLPLLLLGTVKTAETSGPAKQESTANLITKPMRKIRKVR